MSSKKSRRKIKTSTKDDIIQIIDNLSIVTGRKSMPKEDAKEAITISLRNTDTQIAAVSLHVSDIDTKWESLGAKSSFLKIRKKRQWVIRSLFGTSIFGLVIIIAGATIGIIYIDTWVKWLVVGVAAIVILLGSLSVPQMIINPAILNYDIKIQTKFQKECSTINIFIQELLKIIKK